MPETVSNIFSVKNGKERPMIMMSGYIGGWKVNSESLFNAIKKMEKDGVTDCDVFINSGGGSTVEGLTIGEYMQASPIKFHGTVTGMAASMAEVLLQFCEIRNCFKYARLMTHKVKGFIGGEAEQIRAYADLVEQEEEKIIDKHTERTGKSKKVVKSWMKSGVNLWFNATKAKSNNLIDNIIDTNKTAPTVPENATEEEVINTYGIVFNSIVNEYIEIPENEQENPIDIIMKKQILTMLGLAALQNALTENSTDEAVLAELRNVFASAKNETAAVNELKEHKEAAAKLLIENAIKAGKLTAAEKDEWLKNATENHAMVATSLNRMSGKVNPNSGLKKDVVDPNSDTDQPEIMKGRDAWNFSKWQNEDPTGLGKLHDNHPEAYEILFNKEYNPKD